MKLSKRLNCIIDMCEPCDCIVDVGTDHGKVPIMLANKGLAKHIIATDIKKGPLEQCMNNAKKSLTNFNCKFETILSCGLEKIDKKNKCSIIITGMGYDTIKDILHNIEDYNYNYIILSPHTKIVELIKFLDEKQIDIVEQKTVFEDDKCYFIIKGRRKNEN